MRTIGFELYRRKGIGPGFDFLRVFLALTILFTHSFLIAEGERHQFGSGVLLYFHDTLVPMFFALSGFLIAGSAQRLKLKDFILNRAMRIVPALLVDICVSALIIGPLFTILPWHQYFMAPEFRAYFANVAGVIHYVLPGVFLHNPFPRTVNGSLWTVPFEIGCYVIMSGLMITGLLGRRWIVLGLAIVVAAYVLTTNAVGFDPLIASRAEALRDGGSIHNLLHHFFQDWGPHLYVYFLAGVLVYLFREHIPHSWLLFVGAAGVWLAAALLLSPMNPPIRMTLVLPAVVYMTLFVGLLDIPPLPLYRHGDYSYGIYLYGYPVQQALVAQFPGLSNPWVHFLISSVVVTGIAVFSWHLVEKPILKFRRKFSFTARKGDEVATMPAPEKPPSGDAGDLERSGGEDVAVRVSQ